MKSLLKVLAVLVGFAFIVWLLTFVLVLIVSIFPDVVQGPMATAIIVFIIFWVAPRIARRRKA